MCDPLSVRAVSETMLSRSLLGVVSTSLGEGSRFFRTQGRFVSRNVSPMAVLLQLKDLHKAYGSQVLLNGAEATLTDDVKVGFVGRNGTGKSTLLRILLGEEELDSGQIVRHPRLRLGYLRQHDPFLPGETAQEFLMRDSGQPDWKCGEVAGQFELKGDYLDGPIAKLSGGWQTRVKLAALLLHEPKIGRAHV